MTQGSTQIAEHPNNIVDLSQRKQQALYIAVREKVALCSAIEKLAMTCADAGYTGPDDIETIQYLARQLRTKLSTLSNDIANG